MPGRAGGSAHRGRRGCGARARSAGSDRSVSGRDGGLAGELGARDDSSRYGEALLTGLSAVDSQLAG